MNRLPEDTNAASGSAPSETNAMGCLGLVALTVLSIALAIGAVYAAAWLFGI